MAESGIITRKATGLVRAVGPAGVFAFGMFALNLGWPVTYMILYVPAFYPGADLSLSILLTGLVCLFIAVMYWILSVSMPRSGGDYVYNTRIIHPSIGFAFNFAYTFFPLFYSAWSAWAMTTLGLGPLFYVLSIQTGDPSFAAISAALTHPSAIFLIGAILLAATIVVCTTGTKRTFQLATIVFYGAMITTILMIVLLATSSRETFAANLQSFTGIDYQSAIEKATSGGFVSMAPFSWTATIESMVWPWFMFPFAMQSTFFAGEIKNISRSQLVGIVGSTAVSIAASLLIWYLSLNTFGFEFLGAMGFTSAFPVLPSINVFAALLTKNALVAALVVGSLVLWGYGWFFTGIMPGSRSMFAWGIDRVVPEVVTKVSTRWHTPVVSYLVTLVIALGFLGALSFTPYFGTLTGMIGFGACFVLAGISGIVFPFRLRNVYDKSPARIQLGKIPLVSVCGIVTVIASAYLLYRTVVDPFAFANNPTSVWTIVSLFIVGFVIWIISYFVRKSHGIDIMAAYRELPIE